MSQVERYHLASIPVLAINHCLDKQRQSHPGIATHKSSSGNQSSMQALFVDQLREALDHSDYQQCQVMAIDEAQFFEDLFDVILKMVEQDGKIVYLASLDGTYKRQSFGQVHLLLPLCDTIHKLQAVCKECPHSTGSRPEGAIFTQALFDTLAPSGQPTCGGNVNVGGADKYQSVCRKCYLK